MIFFFKARKYVYIIFCLNKEILLSGFLSWGEPPEPGAKGSERSWRLVSTDGWSWKFFGWNSRSSGVQTESFALRQDRQCASQLGDPWKRDRRNSLSRVQQHNDRPCVWRISAFINKSSGKSDERRAQETRPNFLVVDLGWADARLHFPLGC